MSNPNTPALRPGENIALTIALSRIERGLDVGDNTTAVLVWALARLVGRAQAEDSEGTGA